MIPLSYHTTFVGKDVKIFHVANLYEDKHNYLWFMYFVYEHMQSGNVISEICVGEFYEDTNCIGLLQISTRTINRGASDLLAGICTGSNHCQSKQWTQYNNKRGGLHCSSFSCWPRERSAASMYAVLFRKVAYLQITRFTSKKNKFLIFYVKFYLFFCCCLWGEEGVLVMII